MGLLFALFLLAFILFVAITDLRAMSVIKPTLKPTKPFSSGGWTPGPRPASRRGPESVTKVAAPVGVVEGERINP